LSNNTLLFVPQPDNDNRKLKVWTLIVTHELVADIGNCT